MENINISELVTRMGSDEDAVRKMAVFKLQTNIGDPSFADVFISEGGMGELRSLALHASGNTLAYSLTSFSRLLEVDRGWEYVNQDLVERVVELVVTHPLVNILRGAMSILAAVVSHPQQRRSSSTSSTRSSNFGFRALKPAIAVHPNFLEMLVSRLSSADHALCTNALQLINSLMRDAITNDSDSEWPRFIKRLQELGVIKAVYNLMQDSALQDLAYPLLEFQTLSKVLLRKWRDIPVDLERQEHRRTLKALHKASNPPDRADHSSKESIDSSAPSTTTNGTGIEKKRSTKHHPEKWRRLGFETESPAWEFEEVGYLGMMDLADYVRKKEDGFRKLLLEQSARSTRQRCPVARASLAVTLILYEHFEIDKSDVEDAKAYMTLDSRSSVDRAFKPLLLQWSRLHTAGLQAFFRLWKATQAEIDEFDKVADLVRILVEQIVGQAPRTKSVPEVEEEMSVFSYQRLRELQMELLELTYEDAWGHHLRQVRDELRHEALQFVKEQRIRSLLAGQWFSSSTGFKFVRLSHNRRYLHYADFGRKQAPLDLDALPETVDLSIVSSVESNVSKGAERPSTVDTDSTTDRIGKTDAGSGQSTQITIHGRSGAGGVEKALLSLTPPSHAIAAEWVDGLLMLLNQAPITQATQGLVDVIASYGLKIRLLNVRFDDAIYAREEPEIPSREGLEDDEYYYDVLGG